MHLYRHKTANKWKISCHSIRSVVMKMGWVRSIFSVTCSLLSKLNECKFSRGRGRPDPCQLYIICSIGIFICLYLY